MAFWPEMTFWPEIFFLPDIAIWQEIAFRPEMAISQNWTNQLHFGQNGQIFFPEMAFQPELALLARIGSFGQNCLFQPQSVFQSELAFQPKIAFWTKKKFARNVFLAEIAVSRKWFLAKNTFIKFELALWKEMDFSQELSFCQMWLKSLTSQSIERFGSPFMAESFQACFSF